MPSLTKSAHALRKFLVATLCTLTLTTALGCTTSPRTLTLSPTSQQDAADLQAYQHAPGTTVNTRPWGG